ncbi:hypothetical protein NF867_09865 [Solitalea sp. MAHUQ-68]|uniref:Uncharacterized protein n=1 Tax=Solitalea agri TaxID=2953739 RepID=A0A9X2JDQ9_9SPHI|nr:hypothetical protein [Solitalea agri]MCO4293170.1 hypothetical protein [Solitalea agri]
MPRPGTRPTLGTSLSLALGAILLSKTTMIEQQITFSKWTSIISDTIYPSIDKIETEGYQLKVLLSDSEGYQYILNTKVEVYEISHEEHFFHYWEQLNKSEYKLGNTLEIKNSSWLKRFSTLQDDPDQYLHLMIISDDIVLQFITEEYPVLWQISKQ